ncbi:hypothetical protein MED217_17895 [Leeuwenhoekiella blandensis MED217]|uniref:Uncharacterized protein n=1 Tax=Leeuwenhoekiella blandensis (strain CECT 7118 / CCUG 51940 / KCTC 22103 / MED217) TaxID=398720 RepID=A3XH05_LEEBM|nr:hypothetical protein MED217_17895 [Leeuwenhoekiella blandensis MED217]
MSDITKIPIDAGNACLISSVLIGSFPKASERSDFSNLYQVKKIHACKDSRKQKFKMLTKKDSRLSGNGIML